MLLQEPSGCCVPGGRLTTPHLTSYSTLQSQRRRTNYQDCLGCNSRPSRLNIPDNYASLRGGGGLYPSCGLEQCQTNTTRLPPKIPSASPSYVAAVSTGSSVSSSELNHSLTTSDTSDISSERDRESEVWGVKWADVTASYLSSGYTDLLSSAVIHYIEYNTLNIHCLPHGLLVSYKVLNWGIGLEKVSWLDKS